jgi:DNA polymerase-1
MVDRLPFHEIWAVDFEFDAKPGENPKPVCLVAWELRSGRKVRVWQDEFGVDPPYSTGPDSLIVCYYASAEIGCHLALDWPAPERVLDLFTEFRNLTNGLPTISVRGAKVVAV